MSKKDKYLHVGNGIDIFFREDGRADYKSAGRVNPEAVERQVYEWQTQHPDHQRFEFSERWVQHFDLPAISEAANLASVLDLDDRQSRHLVHAFRAVKTLAYGIGVSTQEAETVAIDVLKGLIEKHRTPTVD
jgi:hypothetical protein